LEKVYENALVHELRKNGLLVQQQVAVKVQYDQVIVGDYIADILVAEKVLVHWQTAMLRSASTTWQQPSCQFAY